MNVQFWNVYRKGRLIDSVPYSHDMDRAAVIRSLIEHDGYPQDITVRRHHFRTPAQPDNQENANG